MILIITQTLTNITMFHGHHSFVLDETPRTIDVHTRISAIVFRCFNRSIMEEIRFIDDIRMNDLKITPW